MVRNMEIQLLNDNRETIPEKDLKRIMVSCIMGAARREIIPFLKLGVAFEKYEAWLFFEEMMKRLPQQK